MTRVEQHQMVERLRSFTTKMDGREQNEFSMMLKRDKDDEDFDLATRERLERLHHKYIAKKSKQEVEELWARINKPAQPVAPPTLERH